MTGLSLEDIEAYQYEMIDFVHAKPQCALWVDMGLGKTVACLTALTYLMDSVESRKTLVIAPLRVAKKTWPDEIENWSHIKGTTYEIVCGSAKERRAALAREADVYLINKENVVWLVEQLGNKWDFDTLIIDEASDFRSSKAKRFRALRKVRHRINRVVELTGTPAPKDLIALWSQIFLLDGGERLGKTITAYKQQYFEPDYSGFNWMLKPGSREKIMDKIRDIVLVLRAEDHVQLPKVTHETEHVELPQKARGIYRELEKEFLVQLENAETVFAMNAGVLTGKLRQCANGALYTNDKGAFTEIHNSKIDALGQIIARHPDESILLAYAFKSDRDRIIRRYQFGRVLSADPEDITLWNDKKIPLLLTHPASAGHGLNLQFGGRIIVWFGDTWDLEQYLQFNARLARRGQKEEVLIYHISALNTVDPVISARLIDRNYDQNYLLNALKKDVKSHLIAA